MNRHLRYASFACLAIFLAAAIAVPADAFEIYGKIVNGTTGDKNVDTDVIIVNPSGGMAREQTVRATGGEFAVTGLDGDSPIYLVRVDYQGIAFTESVRPEGRDEDCQDRDHRDVTILVWSGPPRGLRACSG